jgi:hypothetical protein
MARQFFTTLEFLARVEGALGEWGRVHPSSDLAKSRAPVTNQGGVLEVLASRLLTVQELAEGYSPAELAEMRNNLKAGVDRHIDACSRGYGDALRSNAVRTEARRLSETALGKKPSPIDKEPWSANKTNRFIAGMVAIGYAPGLVDPPPTEFPAPLNESSVRSLQKPLKQKHRFYLDEIEPRAKRKADTKGAS